MKQYHVAVIGATGMVGQRFVSLLQNHPWFQVTTLAASSHSAGKTYEQAVGSRWMMSTPIPEQVRSIVVKDAVADAEEIARSVDFVFCAVDMKKEEIRALEERYAKLECPIMSNNSAHRFTPDVPMIDSGNQRRPRRNHRRAEKAPGYQARLHRRQIQLLAAELCSCAASATLLRHHQGACLHLSGHFRRGQKL